MKPIPLDKIKDIVAAFEPHPFSALFPPMQDDDFEKLQADITANGLQQPIVLYQGKILDGNNRHRACKRGARQPMYVEFEGTDAQAQAYVISANIHRRHLSSDQRREIIAKLIKADPAQSNRQIAETAKASHHTVGDVRAGLEATGQIAQLDATTGADGKKRKRKPKPKTGSGKDKPPKPEKEKIEYSKVVDAITASKAYRLFEQELVDALEEFSEYATFDHVEQYAQDTIDRLQQKLGQMQPEETEESEAA